ncbi:sigma-70 family RNA polymerase sigma factor [Smaragdicoccus niigatensis]|uniref:sigma-70 family RNA polymerase sigma factor n=1 Tax=Smaragdicoccus niigatensis TaxID=359359 RepID=UPI00037ACE28|nr:sigma-70 family RNA polymerase sigma factor [Smaragdicoccus niigatensis]
MELAGEDALTSVARAAAGGDRAALASFIRLAQTDVWRMHAHLYGTDLADDLTQETFLRAIGALSKFAGRSSARTWLMSIARRTGIDHLRAKSARPQVVSDEADSVSPGFSETVALNAILRDLPADRREAFVLTQLLGYSYAEAATIADCPVGTIRSRVARAREDLVIATTGAREASAM